MSIGARLSYIRTGILSMNQKDFANLLNISQGALSEIEHDKRGLSMEAIIRLMEYSKSDKRVSCDWILTGDNPISVINTPVVDPDINELLNTYSKLDSRGKHKVHTVIYEELDRIKIEKTPDKSSVNCATT